MIRPVIPVDAAAIADIYAHYVLHTIITFEVVPPTTIESYTKQYLWLVYVAEGKVCGFSYTSKYCKRQAYKYPAGSSVYLYLLPARA